RNASIKGSGGKHIPAIPKEKALNGDPIQKTLNVSENWKASITLKILNRTRCARRHIKHGRWISLLSALLSGLGQIMKAVYFVLHVHALRKSVLNSISTYR